jgi:chromatin segregation and condensation protein Rec8/ScpA/Scc1 (kleisin family)
MRTVPWNLLEERLREAAALLETWPPEAPERLEALAAELEGLMEATPEVTDPAEAARLAELVALAARVLELARARRREASAGLTRVRRTRALEARPGPGPAGGHVDRTL